MSVQVILIVQKYSSLLPMQIGILKTTTFWVKYDLDMF